MCASEHMLVFLFQLLVNPDHMNPAPPWLLAIEHRVVNRSAQTTTRILILWKRKSRLASCLRQTFNKEASDSPNHKLDNGNLKSVGSELVPHALAYVSEFGLSTTEDVQFMSRIWYNYPHSQARDDYVGIRMVFDTPA
jgi:hypothetical protein